jgi:hypothetical protein
MRRAFIAALAVFFIFHPFGMGPLVFGGGVVAHLADRAFERNDVSHA